MDREQYNRIFIGTLMPTIAYFTAEIGLWSELHTYSGGLGVSQGTMLIGSRRKTPLVAMSLLTERVWT